MNPGKSTSDRGCSQSVPKSGIVPVPPTTQVTIEIRIGPKNFSYTVRLPPASMLVISDELTDLLHQLDEAAAQFEYEFVRSLSRRLRTVQEAEDLQVRFLGSECFFPSCP
ncbi:unnamed protein product [Echinostoma caproni]|uniref:Uncharacterized protein n=1 Tax=Echinostoma caproni TaxID=27848 RepID=A0A3P8L8Z6_9TREM|nr:unnamed protein product [Echinostoma caproni]